MKRLCVGFALYFMLFGPLFAADTEKNPCKNVQFYVGNCSAKKHVLKALKTNCQQGSITMLSQMALPQSFVSFILDPTASSGASNNTRSSSKPTGTNTSAQGTTANCSVDFVFATKEKTAGKYSITVETETDGKTCNFKDGKITQIDNGSGSAKSYQQLTVDNKTRIMFGVCEGSIESCACPKI